MLKRIAVLIVGFLFLQFTQVIADEKTNVLLIVLDDLNDYLGVMDGHPQAYTPNLDKLASEGILFTNAHSNAPICAPSRASFFTGILPSTSGNYGFDKWYENTVLKNSKTLAEYYGENGYQTFKAGKVMHHKKDDMWTAVLANTQYHGPVAYNGKNAVGHPSVPEPFRSIGLLDGTFAPLSDVPDVPATDSTPGYRGWWNHNTNTPFNYIDENNRDKMPDEISAEKFSEKIVELENNSSGQPFFIALGIMRPHTPHVVPKKYFDLFPIDSVKIPVIKPNDNDDCKYDEVLGGKGRTAFVALKDSYSQLDEGLRFYLQSYLASVAFADDIVGNIINTLDSSSFKNNTIVVLFSDHGYNLGEKDYLFKNSLWEESTRIPLIFRIPGNTSIINKRVNHPVSLIDVYPTLKELCGLTTSTLKNAEGAPLDGHSLTPFFSNPETNWSGPDVALSVVKNSASPSPAKQNYSVRSENFRYIRYWNGSEELYDHTNDSYEWTNVADDTSYTATKQDLKDKLFQLIPSLNGPFDPLNDFSKTNTVINIELANDNPTNFDGDASRCVRTVKQRGTLIYPFQNIKNFKVEFWGVDSESGSIQVSGSKNGVDYSAIELDSSRLQYSYRYKLDYSPKSVLPDSLSFLKIEIVGGNATWKGQIGSVDISEVSPFKETSATYFIDSQSGSDSNSGKSEIQAWKSLSKINELKLVAGDSVLLKSGSEFFGYLAINGKGTNEKPIYIGKYGGEEQPKINAAGYFSGINILNSSNLKIEDIEITADAGTPAQSEARKNRYGIYMSTDQNGTYENFVFQNLTIHHIFATENVPGDGQNPTSNKGMGFYISMKSKEAKIKNVHIENCRISMVGHTGIKIFGAGDSGGTSYLDSVTIRNNTLEHIGGPGMVPGRCNNVWVIGNTVNYSGSSADPRMHNRGSGIWPWSSKNVLIEKNKFMHAWGKYDSCGAHIDFNCSNVTIQYNLSLDNAGGFVEILGNDQNCKYRYNISINDGYRQKGVNGAGADGHIFWISGYVGSGKEPIGASYNHIYNNTIYTAPSIKTGISMAAGTNNNKIENNIIYNSGEIHYENLGEKNTFDNNIWFGNFPNIPFGKGAVFADPQLINAGDTLPESYKLNTGSLAIGTAGVVDSVNFDFFGNTILNGKPRDRGAFESNIEKATLQIESGVVGDGGNIYPQGILNFPKNADLPFVIRANQGYIINDVVVDGVSVGAVSEYVFSDLTADHRIFVDFFAPPDSVNDPQNNLEIVSNSVNMKIQTDNPENFSGDTGRSVRSNLTPGFLLYHFKEIEKFEVDFWSYKNDNTQLKVYLSENGTDFTPINLKTLSSLPVKNRVKTKFTSLANLPTGFNYIKFEISDGDAAWKGQIGNVNIWWLGDNRETKVLDFNTTKGVKIYPNPSSDYITIIGAGTTKKVQLVSSTGNVTVGKISENKIDVSFLKPGMYFLKIKGQKAVKFIKPQTKF